MSKLTRKQAELADLRDDRDHLQHKRDGKPKGKRRRLNRLLEVTRRQIDRAKVRVRKLKKRSKDRSPNVVLTRISPNQSARSGTVRLIVLHSTESESIESSEADLAGVAGWFANPSAQVSSHVITDSDGHSARCVPDDRKAWTCGAFNSASLNIEQVGRAAQSSWPRGLTDETARWIAKWCRENGIPCKRGKVSGGSVLQAGIVTHAELGSAGGGHHDPGSGFDVQATIDKAKRLI